ncbi:MAG: cadherin domain-containing protein, partial [Planctomycetaceae bacterium]|nr:cadherin domain-containing protein [Planctomycetaceae bacterium]
LWIGHHPYPFDAYYLQGGVDEVAVYNAPLSAPDILARYQGASLAPTAVTGGPYVVNAGQTVTLNGNASTDPNSGIAAYEWDFDYVNSTFTVDATGATSVFDATAITNAEVRTVALRVTDATGLTNVATTTLTVQGLVALWSFDEGTGSIAGESVHGLNGAINGNANWVQGIDDGALYLDGNDTVDVPHSSILNVSNNLTLEAWVRFDSVDNNYEAIVTKTSNSSGNNWESYAFMRNRTGDLSESWMGRLSFNLETTAGRYAVRSTFVPVANQWYYLVGTYDGTVQKLYVNGQLDSEIVHSGTVISSTQPLWIGHHPYPFDAYYLQGGVDEITVYNRARSAAEILAGYDGVNAAPTAVSGGPYSVDEARFLTLDASGSSDPNNNIVRYEWDYDYDGSTFQVDATGVQPLFSATTIDGPATRTIALRVIDAGGLVSPVVATTVQIDNVAPTISLNGAGETTEGSVYSLELGAITDPGDDTVTSIVVNWGDGTSNTYTTPGVVTHVYADGVSPQSEQSPVVTTISVSLVDEDGTHADAGVLDVVVRNVAPTASTGGPYAVDEGSSIVLDATGSSDPGNDIVSIEWDFNYQSPDFTVDATGLTPTFNAAQLPGGTTYTVTVRVTDSSGEWQIDVTSVTVRALNQPPSLSLTPVITTLPEDADTSSRIAVAEIVITDDGRGTNEVSLSGTDASLFEIIGTTLYLKAGTVLDHEQLAALGVTVSVDDPTVGSTPDGAEDFVLTITDVNEAPVVAGPLSLTRSEDDAAVSLGLLTGATDPDAGDSLSVTGFHLVSGNDVGITRNGSVLNIDPAAYNFLAVGETAVIQYAYDVTDTGGLTAPQTATITLEGRNDGPVVAGPVEVTHSEDDAAFSVDLLTGASDPDTSDALSIIGLVHVSGNAAGITVSGNVLSVDPAVYGSLSPGESETIQYNFSVSDNHGSSVASTATITITGANDGPQVAVDGNSAVDEGGTAATTGTWSDIDTTDVVSLTASVGSVVKNANGTWAWSFLTSNGPAQSQAVVVTATDSHGATATAQFQLTVNNVAPVIDAAAFDIEENSPNGTVVGTLTATDPGNDTLNWQITGGSGAAAFAIDSATGTITVIDEHLLDFESTPVLELEILVTDGDGGSGTATVTIRLINQASIFGAVFVDVDSDLLYDADETGVDGVTVDLTNAAGDVLFSTVTHDGGMYLFEDLPAGTYRIVEHQPSGVNDAPEIVGDQGGMIVANDVIEVTLSELDAHNYNFTEVGVQLSPGDTAPGGFWQNKHGQQLISEGGAALAVWLTHTFPNVFGDALVGATGDDVAVFYKDTLFKQQGKKSATPPKVDAQFMAIAMSAFFTNRNLAGTVAASYGFNVTDTGIGTSMVNVGSSGAAFGVADNTDLTIMQILLATNGMTDVNDNRTGFTNVYDINGDGVVDSDEREFRLLAQSMYDLIIGAGSL